MNKKNDMIAALSRRKPADAVPVWELEFQAWDTASGRHAVLGHEFEDLVRALPTMTHPPATRAESSAKTMSTSSPRDVKASGWAGCWRITRRCPRT